MTLLKPVGLLGLLYLEDCVLDLEDVESTCTEDVDWKESDQDYEEFVAVHKPASEEPVSGYHDARATFSNKLLVLRAKCQARQSALGQLRQAASSTLMNITKEKESPRSKGSGSRALLARSRSSRVRAAAATPRTPRSRRSGLESPKASLKPVDRPGFGQPMSPRLRDKVAAWRRDALGRKRSSPLFQEVLAVKIQRAWRRCRGRVRASSAAKLIQEHWRRHTELKKRAAADKVKQLPMAHPDALSLVGDILQGAVLCICTGLGGCLEFLWGPPPTAATASSSSRPPRKDAAWNSSEFKSEITNVARPLSRSKEVARRREQ